MDNGEALYKAICQSPECDTSRLIYADWLDEQDDELSSIRAEYIRMSVGLQFPPDEANFAAIAQWDERRKKCQQTMMEYGKTWIDTRCPLCDGHKRKTGIAENVWGCNLCYGTGNVFNTRSRLGVVNGRQMEYERGFLLSVRCRIEEVFPTYPFDDLYVSDWVEYMVSSMPITQFMITDILPYRLSSGSRRTLKSTYQWIEYVQNGVQRHTQGVLPKWLFDLMWKEDTDSGHTLYVLAGGYNVLEYHTQREAQIALASAIGREVRRRVYG